jgi:uncharacterized membrane protein YkoI
MMMLRMVGSPRISCRPAIGRRCAQSSRIAGDGCLIADVSDLSGGIAENGRRKDVATLMRTCLIAAIVSAGLLVPGPAAHADRRDRDQDVARQAVERGEIKALADILAAVREKLPGEVVGVEIERRDGRWFYELRVSGAKGRLFEVYVDARTGAIERIKEK